MLLDIEPEELHSKMQDPSFIEEAQLIDVREPEEVYVSFYFCPSFCDQHKLSHNILWYQRHPMLAKSHSRFK